jgi:chemotaxis protein histidine kinase CheA
MSDNDEGLPSKLYEKYRQPLTNKDMVRFYHYKELMDQMEELVDASDDEKMRLGQTLINKISGVVEVLQRMLFKASRDADAPEEVIMVMIEQLTRMAIAQGGADFVDFSTVNEMEDMMKEGDEK